MPGNQLANNVVRMKAENFEGAKSSLINRNIVVNGHRTSVRLEAEMWSDLLLICRREGKSLHEMCSLIHTNRKPRRSLTSAIRCFLLGYYRAAATEEGHSRAGHGAGYQIGRRVETPLETPLSAKA